MKKSAFFFLGMVGALSACGGSSTSSSGSLTNASFETLAQSGRSLIAEYGSASPTDVANMPTSGAATYRGVAAYSASFSNPVDIVAYAETVSALEVTADFASSTVSGQATNFQYFDPSVDLNGQINLNGTITGNRFNASLSGSITESAGGITATGNYTGSASGDFVGASAEGLRGTGVATGDYGLFGTESVYTVFGAERQ